MNKKIVHILHNEKFTTPFYELIDENFDSSEHFFIFLPGVDEGKFRIPIANNVLKVGKESKVCRNKIKLFQLLNSYCKNAEKIILHSLLKQDVISFLFFYRSYLKKCYWVMWGGDVYQRPLVDRTPINYIKRIISRYIGKVVKSKVGHCITYLKGDYFVAQELYGTRGTFHECIMYSSNLYKEIELPDVNNETKIIMVGNSADETNNHEQIIKKLSALKEQNFKIICPLSYGPKKHAGKIIQLGKLTFGERFIPLSDFILFEEYLKILVDVDVAIFAHKRQQAMGSIITLLALGKKVYLRNDITPFKFFRDLNVDVFDFDYLDLKSLDKQQAAQNKEKVGGYFSEENLLNQLKELFQ